MSLSDLEKKILAEGERLRALAHKGALEARKLHLLQELEQIEADLASLIGKKSEPKVEEPAVEPEPEPEEPKAEESDPAPEAEEEQDASSAKAPTSKKTKT